MDNKSPFNTINIHDIIGKVLGEVPTRTGFKGFEDRITALLNEFFGYIKKKTQDSKISGHFRPLCLENPSVLYPVIGISEYAIENAGKYKKFNEGLSGWVASWVVDEKNGKKELKRALERKKAHISEYGSLVIFDTAASDLEGIKIIHRNKKVDIATGVEKGACSIMVVPLKYLNTKKLVGILVVEVNKKGFFLNKKYVDFVESFAVETTSAIDYMLHYSLEMDEKEKIRKVNERVEKLLNLSKLEDIYKSIIGTTGEIFDCRNKTNIDLEIEIGGLLKTVATNRKEKDWEKNLSERGLRGYSLKHKKAIFYPSYLEELEYQGFIKEDVLNKWESRIKKGEEKFKWSRLSDCSHWAQSPKSSSFIHLPLIYQGKAIGVLSLENVEGYEYSCDLHDYDKDIFRNWANQIAVIIKNCENLDRIKTEAKYLESSFDGHIKVKYDYSTTTRRGIIESVNEKAENILKTKREVLKDPSKFTIVDIYKDRKEAKRIEKLLQKNEKIEHEETYLQDRLGNEVPVLISAMLIKCSKDKKQALEVWSYFKDKRKDKFIEEVASAKVGEDFEGLFQKAADILRSTVFTEFCSIFEFRENNDRKKPWKFIPRGYSPFDNAFLEKEELYMREENRGITNYCWENMCIVKENSFIHDKWKVKIIPLDYDNPTKRKNPVTRELEQAYYDNLCDSSTFKKITQILFVPIRSRESNPLGVIRLLNKKHLSYKNSETIEELSKDGFNDIDIATAKLFAEQVSLLFEKEKYNKWTDSFSSILQGRTPKGIATAIVKTVTNEMGFRGSHFRILEGEKPNRVLPVEAHSLIGESIKNGHKENLPILGLEENKTKGVGSFEMIDNCNQNLANEKKLLDNISEVHENTRKKLPLKFQDYFNENSLNSGIIVPLISQKGCVGTLSCYSSFPEYKFSEEGKKILLSFGKIAGEAYSRVKGFDKLINHIHNLSPSRLTGRKLDALIKTGELDNMANEIAIFMNNARCSFYLLKGENLILIGKCDKMKRLTSGIQKVDPFDYSGSTDYKRYPDNYKNKKLWNNLRLENQLAFEEVSYEKNGLDFIKGEGITAWIARTGRYFLSNKEESIKSHFSNIGKFSCKRYLGVPLIYTEKKPLGVIKVEDTNDYFTEFDRQFLEIIAVNLSSAIKAVGFTYTEPIAYEQIFGTKIFKIILKEDKGKKT